MWSVVPSLESVLQGLLSVFTQPSFAMHRNLVVGWIMCLGHRTEFRVFEALRGEHVSRKSRHPFDRFYNFFSRSAWTAQELARAVAVQLVVQLDLRGELRFVVDATLLHKSGKSVWNIGWFHDPVASTKKRVATALGNKWVVLALLIPIPGTNKFFCLPVHALLMQPGKGHPGEAALARRMLEDVLSWFPDRQLVLVGDGGYSAKTLLRDLDTRVRYVGLMRGDAALHDTRIEARRPGQSGPKPKHGPRLPSPREAIKKADEGDSGSDRWRWKTICVQAYGEERRFNVCSFQAVWPKVLGTRAIQVVLCRCLDEGYGDVYLYTTDLEAAVEWVVESYARRVGIEATFKSSKQVMEIERPQHWCRASIEKLAPWVWLTQSIVALWYLTAGRHLPEAEEARRDLGPWETEWSCHHMLRLLRRLTIRKAIAATSSKPDDLRQLVQHLENYLFLAA
jgi:hypothetical protein